jgi:predicted lysophospholipase L1 biosynthesis ABC-type transport system permease subunit
VPINHGQLFIYEDFGKCIWKYKKNTITLYLKVLFMSEINQPGDRLQDVRDIRRLMERSSKFISLSGLSGVAAGLCAIIGAAVARYVVFKNYYIEYAERGTFAAGDFQSLKLQLLLLAAIVFVAAFLSAFYFTWRKSSKNGHSLWDPISRRLFWNMVIPLATGTLFILAMLKHDEWRFVAPASLVFYGLALVNASKFTLADIRYLGYCEIILGLVCMQWLGYGLYFWAIGFGVLHIIYGIVMWTKYERRPAA